MPFDFGQLGSQLGQLGGQIAQSGGGNFGAPGGQGIQQFLTGLQKFRDWRQQKQQGQPTPDFQKGLPGGNPQEQIAGAGRKALGFAPRNGGYFNPGLGGQLVAPKLGYPEPNPWGGRAGGNMDPSVPQPPAPPQGGPGNAWGRVGGSNGPTAGGFLLNTPRLR